MTSEEGLGEMFKGDSADTCAEDLGCADPGAGTTICISKNNDILGFEWSVRAGLGHCRRKVVFTFNVVFFSLLSMPC